MSSQTFHQIFKHSTAINKFSLRNIDNIDRRGESIKSAEFEAAVGRLAKHVSDAFEAQQEQEENTANDEEKEEDKAKAKEGERCG